MHHNSRPHPTFRPGGQNAQGAWQCTPGSLAHLLLTSNFPKAPLGAVTPNVCSAPRSHLPAPPFLMVTPDALNPNPSPAPHASCDSALHFPVEVRSNSAWPPAAPALTGVRWEAVAPARAAATAGASWRGRRPRRNARYCFQNTPAPGIPQTADEAPPLFASLQPLTNGKWSSKSQAGQLPGTVTNVRTFPWKHYKGPRAFLTSARSAIGALYRGRIQFLTQAPEAPESPWVLH